MTDIREKKENVKMHLKELRQNLKEMHLAVTEELILYSFLGIFIIFVVDSFALVVNKINL